MCWHAEGRSCAQQSRLCFFPAWKWKRKAIPAVEHVNRSKQPSRYVSPRNTNHTWSVCARALSVLSDCINYCMIIPNWMAISTKLRDVDTLTLRICTITLNHTNTMMMAHDQCRNDRDREKWCSSHCDWFGESRVFRLGAKSCYYYDTLANGHMRSRSRKISNIHFTLVSTMYLVWWPLAYMWLSGAHAHALTLTLSRSRSHAHAHAFTLTLNVLLQPETIDVFGSIRRLCQSNYDLHWQICMDCNSTE